MLALLLSALGVGVIHTLLGPDHYVPFIVLAKARNWSMWRTTIVTTVCGLGHVLSAVLLGFLVVAMGLAVTQLKWLENIRGELASWFMISFGVLYGIWGLRRAARKSIDYQAEHKKIELTPWILFIIFVFGPCEPLIPFMLYPAVHGSFLHTLLVITVFSVGTLVTMLSTVLLSVYGLQRIKQPTFLLRYSNVFAGMIISGCGLAVKFLGI